MATKKAKKKAPAKAKSKTKSKSKAKTATKPKAKAAAKPKAKVKRKPNAAFMKPMNISELLQPIVGSKPLPRTEAVSYTHLRAHETVLDLVCRLLLEKKKQLTPSTFIMYII